MTDSDTIYMNQVLTLRSGDDVERLVGRKVFMTVSTRQLATWMVAGSCNVTAVVDGHAHGMCQITIEGISARTFEHPLPLEVRVADGPDGLGIDSGAVQQVEKCWPDLSGMTPIKMIRSIAEFEKRYAIVNGEKPNDFFIPEADQVLMQSTWFGISNEGHSVWDRAIQQFTWMKGTVKEPVSCTSCNGTGVIHGFGFGTSIDACDRPCACRPAAAESPIEWTIASRRVLLQEGNNRRWSANYEHVRVRKGAKFMDFIVSDATEESASSTLIVQVYDDDPITANSIRAQFNAGHPCDWLAVDGERCRDMIVARLLCDLND